MPSGRVDFGDFLQMALETACSLVTNRNSVSSHFMFTYVVSGMCPCRMCCESNCEGDN